MAAAVSEEPIVNPVENLPGTSRGGGGFTHFHPGGDDGGGNGREGWRPGLYRLAMWFTVIAVTTLFMVLELVYIVRTTNPDFWPPIRIPRILIASTVVLFASSITCEAARRTLGRSYLIATLSLGCVFVVLQVEAWRQLALQGVFVAGNPHSTFFYLFTGVHGIHMAAGIAMLWYRLWRALFPTHREENLARVRERADAATFYWHVMDGVWISLFLLLWLVR